MWASFFTVYGLNPDLQCRTYFVMGEAQSTLLFGRS